MTMASRLHTPCLSHILLLQLLLLCCLFALPSYADISSGTSDGAEEWGYTDVRPGAHMFWWLYYNEKDSTPSNLPLVLWLQGGPGASGAGYGNFHEVGPLTVDLKPRSSTWLNVAHLLFVDNPVGTGFSYVVNATLLTRNNKQATTDLVTFLGKFFDSHKALHKSPFFVVAESYGGKFASELGVALKEKIDAGSLSINFRGVALGDTWISPIDFLYAWPPLLQSFSLVDEAAARNLLSYADSAESEMKVGNFLNATYIWGDMEEAVLRVTDNVDFYNMLKHDNSESLSLNAQGLSRLAARRLAVTQSADLAQVMNGPIREKLGIIPSNISWSESSGVVFNALGEDFMKDTINEVDELLAAGVNVTIYSGQLDLICCTTGTEAWVQKLKWSGLSEFLSAKRTPLYCEGDRQTQAFVKRHKNLSFYWIMNAGHMVPTDNPCMALKILQLVTGQSSPGLRLQATF